MTLNASTMSNITIAARLNFDTDAQMEKSDERRRSIDMITAKSVISKLENKVDQLETSEKMEKMQNLEKEMAKLVEKLNRYQELSASLKKSSDHTKSVLEKQILSVQREKIKSDEKYDEQICLLKNTNTVLQSTVDKNGVEIQMKSSEIEMLKEQLKLQTKKTDDTLQLLKETEESALLLSTAQNQIKVID
uniref:Uncharacterized protein n=1 Tax=Strigamia maritima TaxID=126957 RepID=T1IM58_STRMM